MIAIMLSAMAHTHFKVHPSFCRRESHPTICVSVNYKGDTRGKFLSYGFCDFPPVSREEQMNSVVIHLGGVCQVRIDGTPDGGSVSYVAGV